MRGGHYNIGELNPTLTQHGEKSLKGASIVTYLNIMGLLITENNN